MTRAKISTVLTDLSQIQTLTILLDFKLYYSKQTGKVTFHQPHPELLYLLLSFCQTLNMWCKLACFDVRKIVDSFKAVSPVFPKHNSQRRNTALDALNT